MKNMKKYLLTTKIAALLLAVSLLLGITLILPSCQITFPFFTPDNVITEEQYSTLAEQLSANVDAGCDKQYANVTSYLVYWGFPAFDKIKVRSIENTYSTYLINDPGYSDPDKLLALATSVANYYIDNILTKDGKAVFSLEEIQNKDLQTDAILMAYAASVGDRYSRYYTADEFTTYMESLSGSFAGIGVYATLDRVANTITVSDIIEGSAAEAAGILPGDMLFKVDDTFLSDTDVDTFMDLIRGEIGTSVTVTVIRDGEEISFTMIRAIVEAPSVVYEMLEGGIAYVAISSFNDNTDEQFIEMMNEIEAIGEVKGYVFDLRYNGGGYLETAINILSHFVPRGTNIVATATRYSKEWSKSNSDHVINEPIVVLCNEYSASAAELFTAAIRDFRNMSLLDAKIVGVTTYTKGKMQNIYPLTDGSAIVFTTGLFNPPCDVNFDGVGVTPDVIVPLIPDGEVDNQYEAALEAIRAMINK